MFVSVCLDGFAALAQQKGLAKNAAKLSGAAQNIRDQIGYTLETPDRIFREKYLALLESNLDASVLGSVIQLGRELSINEAIELAFENI